MTPKEIYKELCEKEGPSIPVFQQYWWMQCVCQGKQWDVALAYDDNHCPIAALPYLIGCRLGMNYILQPILTQYCGPWYRHLDNLSENERLEFEKCAADQLIDQLDRLHLAYFSQHFAPSVTNWLPFFWRGFSQTTRYTYRIPDISNPQRVFDSFDAARRQRQIKKAEAKLFLVENLTAERFAEFHQIYWQSRGQRDILGRDEIVRVVNASLSRNQGILLGLVDEKGVLQAARFVVYDSNSAYSLLSALNPEHHENGASPLLFWHLIQRLSGHTHAFDFEGSMDPGIEQSYRLYGAIQTPFFEVSRCQSTIFPLLLRIKKGGAR